MRPRVTGGLDAPPCHARKRYCHSVAIAAQQRRSRQLPASWAISRIGEDMQLFSCVISENSTQVDCGLSEREEIRVIPSGSCRQRKAFNCSVPGCGRGSRPCPQVTAACRASRAARPLRRAGTARLSCCGQRCVDLGAVRCPRNPTNCAAWPRTRFACGPAVRCPTSRAAPPGGPRRWERRRYCHAVA
jgi:hypothetical protein